MTTSAAEVERQADRDRARGQAGASHSGRGEALAPVHGLRPLRPAARRGGCRRARPLHPVPPRRHRRRRARGRADAARRRTPRISRCGCAATAAIAGRVEASLAVSGGVHTALDVIKATMAGAHVTQMVLGAASATAPVTCGTVRDGIEAWMASTSGLARRDARQHEPRADSRSRRLRARERAHGPDLMRGTAAPTACNDSNRKEEDWSCRCIRSTCSSRQSR